MPDEFPDLKDGDELVPEHLNVIYRELRRIRREPGHHKPSGPILIKLTGSYSSGYPWKEVALTPGGTAQDTGLTGSTTTDPAYELQTGNTGLSSGDTVYQAARSPASGDLLFWGVAGSGIVYGTAGGTISSGGTGTVNIISGGSGSITATLKFSGSIASGVKVYCAQIAGTWHIIAADCS